MRPTAFNLIMFAVVFILAQVGLILLVKEAIGK